MTKKILAVAMSLTLGLLLAASPSQAAAHKASRAIPPVCCYY